MNCIAITKNGTQCKNKVSKDPNDDNQYCHVHQLKKKKHHKRKSIVISACGCGS